VPIVITSGSLSLLECSGPVQGLLFTRLSTQCHIVLSYALIACTGHSLLLFNNSDTMIISNECHWINSYSSREELAHVLHNPRGCYHIHNSLPPTPILSQINAVQALTYFSKIHFNYPPTFRTSSKGPVSFSFHNRTLHAVSLLSQTCHMPLPFHPC
jgi:hypothetical protein